MLVFEDGEGLNIGRYTIDTFMIDLNLTEFVNPEYDNNDFSFQ